MITRGSRVLEARVRGTCNKGTAVRLIRREHPAGTLFVYFGDDMTDRDAFRALRGFGVSVQVGGDEPILADYTLPAPDAVVETLGRIGEAMRAAKTRTRKRPRKSP
jgi:trehalose 6-phosphate phosphatase